MSLQDGETPLSKAIESGHANVVKFLVNKAHADQSKVPQVIFAQLTVMIIRNNISTIVLC